MNVKWVTLALAAVVLAGCGGSDGKTSPTATPTPRVYTYDEMWAALPKADDVEGGIKIRYTCPKDKEACPDPEPGTGSVSISVKATTSELTEAQVDLGINEVQVQISALADEAAAKSSQAKSRTFWKTYDGVYDHPHKDLGGGNYNPSESGRGDLADVTMGRFKGFRMDRESTAETVGKFFSSTVNVRSGNADIEVFVILGVDGRTIADAEKLADRVVADYLKRLG